ncbi:MAG TPA: 1-acyl-sn-glycerol-3-phosphate acyltransferase [Flavobacteriales bacterium]|nr:1-acyl-sn-glycerol-3-phosphate acyltransferase [Flavobacteriales bacterium]
MKAIRVFVRLVLFPLWALLCTLGILLILLVSFILGRKEQARQRVAHSVFRLFLRGTHIIMGVRITWHGRPPKEPSVVMGNHRSYLDAIVLPTSFPVVFVARHETKAWPIIGWGATALGTIWVKRDKKESRKATRAAVKERFDNGYGVVIFPEGTTHKGPDLLPYRKGIFYTCADNGFQIAPAAIEYRNTNIAWVGNEWFIPHACRHFGSRYIDTHVSFGPVFKGDDAEKLIVEVRDWTQKECYRLRDILDK